MSRPTPAAEATVLAVQAGAAGFGAGSCWTVQILNHPRLALVGTDHVPACKSACNHRFIRLTGPALLVDAGTAVAMIIARPAVVAAVCLALLVVIVAATVRYGAQAHARPPTGSIPAVHRLLVRANCVRVAAWTVLAITVLVALVVAHG